VIIVVFLIVFAAVVFFAPDMGGYFLEHANFEPADPLRTPEHIAPVWYFTPFYAVLRAVPNEGIGVALMGLAVLLPFFMPWLDRCRVKSIRYRSWIYKVALMGFAITFIMLGWLGLQPPTTQVAYLSRVFTILYFAFFIVMPFYTRREKTKPVPTRVKW
jgi:ubiquinol-cytochrome c reductase cytochrome b subunit